jgi:hypothetical protein
MPEPPSNFLPPNVPSRARKNPRNGLPNISAVFRRHGLLGPAPQRERSALRATAFKAHYYSRDAAGARGLRQHSPSPRRTTAQHRTHGAGLGRPHAVARRPTEAMTMGPAAKGRRACQGRSAGSAIGRQPAARCRLPARGSQPRAQRPASAWPARRRDRSASVAIACLALPAAQRHSAGRTAAAWEGPGGGASGSVCR